MTEKVALYLQYVCVIFEYIKRLQDETNKIFIFEFFSKTEFWFFFCKKPIANVRSSTPNCTFSRPSHDLRICYKDFNF
jgi:hypothetical protein